MKKIKIEESVIKYIKEILINNGISEDIIEFAKQMDIDIIRLFYDKIYIETKNIDLNKDSISKNLLGVFGNYIASNYFKGLGNEIINEYPVLNKEGLTVTKADIAYKEQNELHLCEVKTTSQIIDNIRNYKDENEKRYNDNVYFDLDKEIIKYKQIGVKVIEQVKKLKSYSDNVYLVVFNGCYIDDIIRDKLKKIGINIKFIAPNIHELEEYINSITDSIVNELKLEKYYDKDCKKDLQSFYFDIKRNNMYDIIIGM